MRLGSAGWQDRCRRLGSQGRAASALSLGAAGGAAAPARHRAERGLEGGAFQGRCARCYCCCRSRRRSAHTPTREEPSRTKTGTAGRWCSPERPCAPPSLGSWGRGRSAAQARRCPGPAGFSCVGSGESGGACSGGVWVEGACFRPRRRCRCRSFAAVDARCAAAAGAALLPSPHRRERCRC